MKLQSAFSAVGALLCGCLLSACSSSDNASAPATSKTEAPTAENSEKPMEVLGAGSSFVYPLLAKWSADFNAQTGDKVNYQSIGSGGGIAQIKAYTVDFGSSDKPLSSEELSQSDLGQFPSTIGGVVPVVNLDGVTPGTLRLTGPLLANIYLGKVVKWDDPAIKALNPQVSLPDTSINLVHRSDSSGTTYNFTAYLSRVSSEWKSHVGENTSVQWPSGAGGKPGVGGKGNEGVASAVQNVKGSIGYVELAYAIQNNMLYTTMQNAAGNWVKPSLESFASAAKSAQWNNVKDFNLVIVNAPGAESWPITAANFILIHKHPKDVQKARGVLSFFKWSLEKGQNQAKELDFVPLPPELVTNIEAYWQKNFNFK